MENLFECRANFYEGAKRRRIKEGYLFVNRESIIFKSYKTGINQKVMISEIKHLDKEKRYTKIITTTGKIYTFWPFILRGFQKDKNKSETLYSILSDLKSEHDATLENLRNNRDNDKVKRSLADLRHIAEGTGNTVPAILECVRCYTTEGEIVDVLREVFGEYQEPRLI